MKYPLLIILCTTISCQSLDFKVGSCVQKPDSMMIYKLETIQDKMAQTQVLSGNKVIGKEEIELSSQWIETDCPMTVQ